MGVDEIPNFAAKQPSRPLFSAILTNRHLKADTVT